MIKILHIGNIANNAWQNARLLNLREGWEAVVLSYDYYHCMGAPEWDEANFRAEQLDDLFAPQWWKADLHGYVRPNWFVQGRMDRCVRFLTAVDPIERDRCWVSLSIDNRTRQGECGAWVNLDKVFKYFRHVLQMSLNIALLRQFLRLMRKFRAILFGCCAVRVNIMEERAIIDELLSDFSRRFPEREDQLSEDDILPYITSARKLKAIWEEYDILQCYAVDPIFPMIGNASYFAFEHGTLRDIPFENSPRGRLTALAYARAEHVFVTNFDCLENAQKIVGDSSKISFLNHPWDESNMPSRDEAEELRKELQRVLGTQYICFFPTRHDWIEGRGYNDKGNDRLIKAVSRLNELDGISVGLVLCDWGHNQAETRALLKDEGLEHRAIWITPQATRRFLIYCMASDIVADQFVLGAFGGILIKTLSAGVPLCTYLDHEMVSRMYPEPPPIINAKSEDEIYSHLKSLLSEPEGLGEIGRAGRRWIEKYHRGEETVDKQIRCYMDFMAKKGGG